MLQLTVSFRPYGPNNFSLRKCFIIPYSHPSNKLCPISLQPNIPDNPINNTIHEPNLGWRSTFLTKNITTAWTFFRPSLFKFPGFWTPQMIQSFPYLLANSLSKFHLPPLRWRILWLISCPVSRILRSILFVELVPSTKKLTIRTTFDADRLSRQHETGEGESREQQCCLMIRHLVLCNFWSQNWFFPLRHCYRTIELDFLGREMEAADSGERRSARARSRNWIFSGVWGPAIRKWGSGGSDGSVCFFPGRWLGCGI